MISFKKDSFKYIFSLPVRIAEDSEIDLILGLDTIKNFNFVQIIPEFFGHKKCIDPWKRISHSTENDDNIFNPVTTPLVTTMGDPSQIASVSAVQEPPASNDLEGEKPSDTDRPRQGDLVSRGACTKKT